MLKSICLEKIPAFLGLTLLCACSASGTSVNVNLTNPETGGAENTGGSVGSVGGTSGNSSNATGGTITTSGGAAATGGNGPTTGGSIATGGAPPTGGSKATGGAAPTGGSKATGGAIATGGLSPTGGSKATGGTTATGGMMLTGGSKPTGGSTPTGGSKATGGSSATGGTSSNSTMTGWTDGYVATMYGKVSSGDCAGYSNFSDNTEISTYTCVLGNGTRKVTLSSYQSGVANNSSFYAALGDLSSLWTANGNASQCTCSGSTSATCGGPSCNDEISDKGSCGICIAVKCDPNSTFKDGGYTHNANCNKSQYVVVQNIDACPHNHTTNVNSGAGWCTDRQAQHIDVSCSALGAISDKGKDVGQLGWIGVSVQKVDCSVGLGIKQL